MEEYFFWIPEKGEGQLYKLIQRSQKLIEDSFKWHKKESPLNSLGSRKPLSVSKWKKDMITSTFRLWRQVTMLGVIMGIW